MKSAKKIMLQGTMSDVGKSVLTAALCRIFRQDGYRVAPFKSQNMALNSFATPDGKEIGRAQAMQAEAAKILPDVRMNPILLKPTGDTGSQVIVNGVSRGTMSAAEYMRYKVTLRDEIMSAYESLASENDIIVIEGAGSPAELNLNENDIVNMGLATMVDAPVLLVGDIDRGGIFAQLFGTTELLDNEARRRIKGLIVNKFRGDPTLFTDGISILEDKTKIPVLGVVPYVNDLQIDGEDSLSFTDFETLFATNDMTNRNGEAESDINIGAKKISDGTKTCDEIIRKVAIIRLPHIANYTDFAPLCYDDQIAVRFVSNESDLSDDLDMIILPGTKNTIQDLLWMRKNGLEERIEILAKKGIPTLGICGGYQMLGEEISDPGGVENSGEASVRGMGLLPVKTVLEKTKTTRQRAAVGVAGIFSGRKISGYEIHNGTSTILDETDTTPFAKILPTETEPERTDGCVKNNIYGTYLHGLFDDDTVRDRKEREYDRLADVVRGALDLDAVYRILS